MHVLYFHQHFSTRQGSTGTRSYEFCRRLISRGHLVTVVCGSYGGGVTGLSGAYTGGVRNGVVDGISVIEFHLPYSNADRFLKRTLIFLKYMLRSSKVALSHDYDVLFATSTPLTVAVPGILAKLLRAKPFVFEVRDLWPELPRAIGVIRNPAVLWSMGILEWLAYRCADCCIALAPGIAEGIHKRLPQRSVRVIPNASDLDASSDESALATELQELLDSLHGKLKCAFAGAHGVANGLDAVLDAAAELRRRGRADIAFIFLGDGMLKPSLVDRARREGLDNCIFLDQIPKRMLTRLQAELDVGLMILANVPAFYNGTSPNKFFDYIAAGLPVVINYPGWLAELVEAERCGAVVPPRNPSAFARALERLADDPEERRAMGARARQLAERKFDRDVLASQFVEILESVSRGKAPD